MNNNHHRETIMNRKQSKFWWIDVILFTGFLVAFFLSFTGLELHQWIGVIGGLLAGYHLLVHWEWFDTVSQRFFQGIKGNVRLKFILDGSMLVGFMGIVGTGLVISSWLSLTLSNYDSWLRVHILISIFTLLVLVTKLALHWKWIARTAHNTFLQPQSTQSNPVRVQPAPARSESMDRRMFLRVMGVAGGASVLALLSATKSLAALESGEVTTTTVENSASDSSSSFFDTNDTSQFGSSNSSGNTTCNIQCGKRCSYPGHCRRYSDADQDGFCDFGECA
jgi:hypothetical protein